MIGHWAYYWDGQNYVWGHNCTCAIGHDHALGEEP